MSEIIEEEPTPSEAPELTRKKYPKGTILLLALEPLRCYAGGANRSTTLLMVDRCQYTQNEAIAIYHIFLTITLCVPILAASIADNWVGKYTVLIVGCTLSTFGLLTTTLMTVPNYNLPIRAFLWLGGITRAIGLGCLNPTYNPIGAEQFELPRQNKFLTKYLSVDYMLVNVFLFISIKITPMLRADVHCLGKTDCYTLAFLIPTLCMIIMTITLLIGKNLFKFTRPMKTDFCVVFSCVTHAIRNRRNIKRAGETTSRRHWLYYAKEKYGEELVKDVKHVLHMLIILLPTAIIWCVYVQFETKWVFQATRLDLRILGYTMKAEEIININTLFCIILLPFIQFVVNPIIATCKLHRPLGKMLLGSILVAIAFFLSAKLEKNIEENYPTPLEPGKAQFRLFNGMECAYKFEGLPNGDIKLKELSHFEDVNITVNGSKLFKVKANPAKDCLINVNSAFTINVTENSISAYYFKGDDSPMFYEDILGHNENGYPLIRVLSHGLTDTITIYDKWHLYLNNTLDHYEIQMINPGKFDIDIGTHNVKKDVELLMGGYYVFLVSKTTSNCKIVIMLCKNANAYSVLYQLPQIFFMSLGEILFAVNLMEFIYGESPNTLKVFVWSFNNLMNALGQILVAIFITDAYARSTDFFLYACVLSAVLVVHAVLILRYKYKNPLWASTLQNDV